MTTYIDHDIDSPTPAVTGAATAGIPGASLMPALWSLWSLPLTTFQMWTTGWASPTSTHDQAPADATGEADHAAQLTVPSELGQPETQEIFA